jgi:hypothetical protein
MAVVTAPTVTWLDGGSVTPSGMVPTYNSTSISYVGGALGIGTTTPQATVDVHASDGNGVSITWDGSGSYWSGSGLYITDTAANVNAAGSLLKVYTAGSAHPHTEFKVTPVGVYINDFLSLIPDLSEDYVPYWHHLEALTSGAMLVIGSDLVSSAASMLVYNGGTGGGPGTGHDFFYFSEPNNSPPTAIIDRLVLSGTGVLSFGAKVATIPALKPVGSLLAVRKGDDSAYGDLAVDTTYVQSGGRTVYPQACNSVFSPGDATCNQGAGRAAVAPSASAVTITNSRVYPDSIITTSLQGTDATCIYPLTTIPGGGFFTFTVNAACTAATPFAWTVFGTSELGIPASSNDVSHLYWDGITIRDAFPNTWTMQGTVPQVTRSDGIPPGSGPYSNANYYYLGTGSDVLDFAVPYTVVIVFTPTTTASTAMGLIANMSSTAGYMIQRTSNSIMLLRVMTAGSSYSDVSSSGLVMDVPNVICAGSNGTTQYLKVNLGTIQTVASVAITAATTQRAQVGASGWTNPAATEIIYEAKFSTDTPTDVLCTSIANTVKTQLGITGW